MCTCRIALLLCCSAAGGVIVIKLTTPSSFGYFQTIHTHCCRRRRRLAKHSFVPLFISLCVCVCVCSRFSYSTNNQQKIACLAEEICEASDVELQSEVSVCIMNALLMMHSHTERRHCVDVDVDPASSTPCVFCMKREAKRK